MKAYIELIRSDLRLAIRDKTVIFFNYMFPLLFFFVFAELFKVRENGTISFVVSMVLVLGVLGNGLWGAGMRVVIEREQHILRRFKVAPISATPILVASMVTGWILYLPAIAIVLGVSMLWYGMTAPARPLSLLLVVTMGLVAFRSIGLILASVANSMQEVNILIQLVYMPMLFLTGSLFPVTMLPQWVQTLSQFLPATYLTNSIKAVLLQNETAFQNATAMLALLLTALLGTFLSVKLFRWEKEDKVPLRSKLWVLAVLAPFILLGTLQIQSRDQIRKARMLQRSLERQEAVLIRGVRIFVGNGEVIEGGSVLVRAGKIDRVFRSSEELPRLQAATLEAAGKTLLPGLIDAHVHLSGPTGIPDSYSARTIADPARNLSAYLYSGVVAIRSVGDPLSQTMTLKELIDSGERLGAEVFTSGPMFTAPGGHGTEYFTRLPEMMRKNLEAETLRIPKDQEEARRQVADLKSRRVDLIKVILDQGEPGTRSFPRLDFAIFRSIAEAARQTGLRIAVHTGGADDIEQAIKERATSIEHGSARERLEPALLDRIKQSGICYVPTLAVVEAFGQLRRPSPDIFHQTLTQQVVPKALLESTVKALGGSDFQGLTESTGASQERLAIASGNLMEAYKAGVTLVAGSDAGNLLVFHGPGIHRELKLWVEAGVPVPVALQAATSHAARLMGAGDRLGLVKPGYDASLILVDGNPLEDISTTERISLVIFKGERVNRGALFAQGE